ncbi:cbb3-type cytochrome c oxidase subunit I [Anaeroselena agilis]|uniref:Cbb3-type cytochrome c oxidase subunit I n=1 Tax=Anaeroselena agilis TaxID=3063788 RepID=A0ABU3P007_9FIRM|nr:cbb3-type cytochrome c oxidase subunit I [Selenomonadales bacterium 4137-cl]
MNRAVKLAFLSAACWLLLGILLGLWMAVHFAFPEIIYKAPVDMRPFIEYGKIRQVHVNVLAFAWLSLTFLGGLIYAIPHMTKTALQHEKCAVAAIGFWNIGLLAGNIGLLMGYSRGREYASMFWPADLFLLIAFLLLLYAMTATIRVRTQQRMNVGVWYLYGSLIWMPLIIVLGKGLYLNFITNPFSGYFDNVANWFLGHNILGLWFTTLGIGMSYFMIPRITHQPVYSHYLSVIGLWSLAVFYPAVGAHHTLDGPVPRWLMAEATVFSVLMVIPVTAAIWNLYKMTSPRWDLLWTDNTLRFVLVGLTMYMLVSFQGSFQALMFVSKYLHFSQWVPGHAMLALGGGFTFIAIGTIYYIMPKLFSRHWWSDSLAAWHFWLSTIGITGIFLSLTVAGLVQGANWQNAIAGMHWVDAVVRASHPHMVALVLSGLTFVIAQVLFVINIVASIRHGEQVELMTKEDVLAEEGAAAGKVFAFEHSLPRLAMYMLATFSFAVVTTYAIPAIGAKELKPGPQSVQYTALQARGRAIYIREGCLWCHSQMVRNAEANEITVFRRGDIGNFTSPEVYYYQNPVLFEQHRRGPDLSHAWARWPSEFWQKEHLKDPSRFNPGTWMVPFSYLPESDVHAVVEYLKTLR